GTPGLLSCAPGAKSRVLPLRDALPRWHRASHRDGVLHRPRGAEVGPAPFLRCAPGRSPDDEERATEPRDLPVAPDCAVRHDVLWLQAGQRVPRRAYAPGVL